MPQCAHCTEQYNCTSVRVFLRWSSSLLTFLHHESASTWSHRMAGLATALLEVDPYTATPDVEDTSDEGKGGGGGSYDESWHHLRPCASEDILALVTIKGVGKGGPCSLMTQVEVGVGCRP